MPLIPKQDFKQRKEAYSFFIYGPAKVGKTTSALSTSPGPILYIWSEKRTLIPNLKIAGLWDEKEQCPKGVDVFEFTTFEELVDFLSDYNNIKAYKSIIVDSITDIMNVDIMGQLLEEQWDNMSESEKKGKSLTKRHKAHLDSYGTLSKTTIRLTDIVRQAVKWGINVIAIARVDEKPRLVEGTYRKEPLLGGNDYGKQFDGFFDMIGYVERAGKDKSGKVKLYSVCDPKTREEVFPPCVMFASPNGDFIAGWTGPSKQRNFQLDITKIIEANK